MTNDIIELSPGSELPPSEKRVWSFWPTAGFGAVIIIVYFLVLGFVMAITMVVIALSQYGADITVDNITDSINSYLGLYVSLSSITGGLVGIGLILAFVKAKRGADIVEYLGLKRFSWKTLLVVILITAVFVVAAALVDYFWQLEDGDSMLMVDIYNTSVWPVLLWIAVVVFAPLFEEPLIRGFLFEGFRHSRIGIIGAIFLTSLIWTALHVGYSLYSLGTIFVFGLVLGAIRYRTGSLWSTILMHACYNAVGMTLIALSAGM